MFNTLCISTCLTLMVTIVSQANVIEEPTPLKMTAPKQASQAEAKALFNWAMVYLKANGADIAYSAFNKINGKFTDRDLYVFCLNYDKVWTVMGANPLLVGHSAANKRDRTNKDFIAEFLTIAKTSGYGTVSYLYKNPVTGNEQFKISFIQKVADNEFCGMGFYQK